MSLRREKKQKAGREDNTPAESSINTIPGDQKMARAFLPHSRGDLETLTVSSGAFILQAGHRGTFDMTSAGAKMGSKEPRLLYHMYLSCVLRKLYLLEWLYRSYFNMFWEKNQYFCSFFSSRQMVRRSRICYGSGSRR